MIVPSKIFEPMTPFTRIRPVAAVAFFLKIFLALQCASKNSFSAVVGIICFPKNSIYL